MRKGSKDNLLHPHLYFGVSPKKDHYNKCYLRNQKKQVRTGWRERERERERSELVKAPHFTRHTIITL
jgi:hypothetical protein